MSFEIKVTEPFQRKLKRLAKKYKSIKQDLGFVLQELENNPEMGVFIGKNCYKIRIAIQSKGKGKSGGARMITYVRILKNTIFLLDIFDKSEQPNIFDKELQMLIEMLAE